MHLSHLKLTHFKSYAAQTFDFSPRLNCLTGLNGVGKTNVLDAVHFLCLCKSHAGLNDRHLVQHGESFFRLEGQFEQETGAVKIVAKFQTGHRKEIERNGNAYERLLDYIGQFPVVMIAPDDVSLVQDGSEDRRRFLDSTLSQISPDYLQNLLIYNALLKQRNALLKHFAEQKRFDPILLESLDRQMPAPAKAIFDQRSKFAEAFQPLFLEYYAIISNSRESVGVRYESDLEKGNFADLMQQSLEKDRLLQRSTVGPHRDDLALFMDGQAVKKFASQGQLKSFLLALRLAQYEVLRREKNVSPILLLDDIFDKLDTQRVRQLVELLISRDFGQIFITDTQRERIETVIASFLGEYKIFEVFSIENIVEVKCDDVIPPT
ncbi:MAG: DNA replication/repair protein RecF [Phycisphaerae bacterium]|nr:DNA replication/repair protein RecF [Saprospiraceae bacterium]